MVIDDGSGEQPERKPDEAHRGCTFPQDLHTVPRGAYIGHRPVLSSRRLIPRRAGSGESSLDTESPLALFFLEVLLERVPLVMAAGLLSGRLAARSSALGSRLTSRSGKTSSRRSSYSLMVRFSGIAQHRSWITILERGESVPLFCGDDVLWALRISTHAVHAVAQAAVANRSWSGVRMTSRAVHLSWLVQRALADVAKLRSWDCGNEFLPVEEIFTHDLPIFLSKAALTRPRTHSAGSRFSFWSCRQSDSFT